MKRRFYYSLTIICLLLGSSFIYSQGRITEVKKAGGLFPTIVVRGYASHTMWVGCTIHPDTYNEIDLDPQKVKKGNFEIVFDMSVGLTVGLVERAKGGSSSIPYVVALWEKKINLRKCEKKYGKDAAECKWARKNGYQMEGRIDRHSGSYTP